MMGGNPKVPLLELLWIMLRIQLNPYATSRVELFLTKNRKLFLNVVTEIFALNVPGLLNPTLKHIHKFTLRQ